MEKLIRILHLEDLSSDALLVKRELGKGSFAFELQWVRNRSEFEKAITENDPDIVLCDHSLPSFNSLEALQLLKEKGKKIPFILITSTVSEEFMVKMIREGIDDYILKDRLKRLPSAVLNSIERVAAELDREKYLNEIISQEKKFRALIENLSEAILLINESGIVTYQSQSCSRVIGYSRDEIIGSLVFGFYHPDDADDAAKLFRQSNDSPAIALPTAFRMKHKSGEIIYTEGTLTNLMHDESVKAYVINFRDISARKNAENEKEKITSDLIRHVKNLEQFAYIISHNLRSPVANIIGLSNLLKDIPDLSKEDFDRCLEGLTLSVKKLDEIIIDLNFILQIRREINEKKEVVKFSSLLRDITTSINNLLEKENIVIQSDFKAAEFFTLKSYLNSIFYNLISNSIKYRHPDRQAEIQVKSWMDANCLYLTFSDNGLGIDLDSNEGKIFGLYKKFHPHIEGKGMGLYMVKTQVEILGGTITVNSKELEGTEFIIAFNI